ncbi:MAG: AAA-like domain-containing protein [Oscillatoria princeps RMCB-10]|jgi:WD40 repeat protein|nr:AAA-like domain-containing protein [Oscillatoria princeps RMCB-10]
MSAYKYQVGGSLEYQHPTYVVRQADFDLYDRLKAGEFCYVLNSRQMGKSSLRVQMMRRLKNEGMKCASIDMTQIGRDVPDPEKWYGGIVSELLRGFSLLRKVDFKTWWRERELLPPVQRLSEFIEDVVLAEFSENLVIFIDEIDSVISLKFPTDDFFALLRSCYNRRAENSEFNRLTFCLLGVGTPQDLIEDKQRTPFNIGEGIELTGFQFESAKLSLIKGLAETLENPERVLQEILDWTGGQPFLTQKLCKLVVRNAEPENPDIEQLVQTHILENWEAQDDPEHLRTIRNRLLSNEKRAVKLLGLYRQILQEGEIAAEDTPDQVELRLSGLVVKNQGKLKIYNRIYENVFNLTWVDEELAALRPYSEEIVAWLTSNREDESRLLRGQKLETALKWALGESLSDEDYQFLSASQDFAKRQVQDALELETKEREIVQAALELETKKREIVQAALELETKEREILDKANQKANRRIRVGLAVLAVSLGCAGFAVMGATQAGKQFQVARESSKSVEALRQFESGRGEIDALMAAMRAGQTLQKLVPDSGGRQNDSATAALGEILDQIRERNQFHGHAGAVTSVSFSPDGKHIATASRDKTARLWDLQGKPVAEFKGHESAVWGVSFSPDRKYLATASADGKARLWDLSGKELAKFSHQGSVGSVSFSPDSKRIATASADGTAKLWDLSGKQIAEFKANQGVVLSVSFSPDGKRIATASDDGKARLWDLSGKLLKEFKAHKGWVWSVSFSPKGDRIATASTDGSARLWDLSGKLLREFKGNQPWVLSVSFSSNGERVATASADGTARLWDLDGNQLAKFQGHGGTVGSVSFSPDGKMLATASADGTAKLWDIDRKQLAEFKAHRDLVFSVSFSPDGKMLATASADGVAKLWDLKRKLLAEFKGHQGRLWGVSFSPDGKRIATASADGSARLWDLSGKLLREFKGHGGWVTSACFSPEGDRIATTSLDGKVRLWDLSGKKLAEFQAHPALVWRASFSAGGKYLATASDDGTARLWDLSGKLLGEFKGHYGAVFGVSFSPNGKELTTASDDGTAKLWDLSGQELREFKGHNGAVFGVSFRPDGKYVATASADGSARLWDLSGKELARFEGNQLWVLGVSFSPDGKSLATASADGSARLWLVNPVAGELDALLASGCRWLEDYFVSQPQEKLEVCR